MAIKKSDKNKRPLFVVFWETILLSWRVSRKLFIFGVFLTIIGGVLPIAYSYTWKVFLDNLISHIGLGTVVPVILVSYLAYRYIIDMALDFQDVFLNQYIQRLVRFKMDDYLNYTISEKISSLDAHHFEDLETQNLIQRVREGSIGRIPVYTFSWFGATSMAITLIGAFLALIPYGWWPPLLAMAISIPRLLAIRKRIGIEWTIFNRTTPENRKLIYLSGLTQDQSSVLEFRIFGARENFLNRLRHLQDTLLEKSLAPLNSYAKSMWAPVVLEAIFFSGMVYLKIPAVLAGILSVGSLTFFVQMLDRVTNNTRSVSNQLLTLSADSMYIENYFKLMSLQPLLKDKIPGHILEPLAPPLIKFQNISFAYPDKSLTLKKISFTIQPGEHLAIVGPNGAGKTTLVKLLMRFYDPTSGSILVNDFDLKDLQRKNWYTFVSTLFQSFRQYLLTIRDNITLSGDSKGDEEKMKKSAKMAGADEFIDRFPQKYDTLLGRQFGGEELSVGQWQKLALARAFYEEAPVLILDEPTSAIDAEAEAEIFDNLNKVYKDKTVIFISHRFSTVRNADKIIVLKDGRIAEEGTHESLLKKAGIYARMFNKQAEGYID
jgi:ATP-binding cassette subfamily B protein